MSPAGTDALPGGRRRFLGWGCAHCAVLAGLGAPAARAQDWVPPPRHARPELSTDEGGLWAMLDREETRVRRSSFVVRDKSWGDYLNELCCRLAGDHCPDMRVYTVRTPMFNATMAPNGMMQVWTGLLLRVENEAQLASVIGHEIGHYLQRHSLERLRDARSKSAFATFMAPFGLIGLVGQIGAIASLAAFSREHEMEADRIGVTLVRRAGLDPREAARVWTHVRAELSAGPAGDPAKRSVMWATHPGIDERQTRLGEITAGDSGDTGEARYLERLEPLLWPLAEDELRRAQYDESIVLFDRLATRRTARADLRWFRGEARRLRAQPGDADAARADFEAALTLDKPPAQTHRSLAFLHREQGRRTEAIEAFRKYLEAAPEAGDAGLVRSYLSELQG